MKVPKAKQLPSGNWNVQVMVNGTRVSITAESEPVAIAKAAAVKAGMAKVKKSPKSLSLGEAIDRYIDSKDAVLSPSTIAGYRRIRKNALPELMSVSLSALTQERIQRAVNNMAKEKSPKSVRNAHGLISAVLAEYMPDMVLRTTLPQKRPAKISIPDEEDIAAILQGCAGTPIELPILLAMWLGLRASEIRGLTWECIDGDYLHIRQAIVEGPDGPAVKGTKTFSGNRKIRVPPYIMQLIHAQPKKDEYIIHLSGQAMYKAFSRLCERLGLSHYRFHDLRHASASVAMMLGVPDKYNQQRMGHKTDNMLKTVYLHTLPSKEDEFADRVDEYFNKLQTKLQTKNQNP